MDEEIRLEQVSWSRKRIAIYAGGGLAIIAFIALVVAVLAKDQKAPVLAPAPDTEQGRAVTQAPAPTMPDGRMITQAPPPSPAPTAQPVQPPPQDVLDFLKDVEVIEQHRQFLLKDKGPALALMAGGGDALEAMIRQAMDPSLTEDVDPLARVRTEVSRQLKHWQDVLKSFDTLKPPVSCRAFAGAYRWVLTTEAQQIGRISTVLANTRAEERDSMNQALSVLNSMRADPNTQGSISKAVDESNNQLDVLCKQFGIQKPFSVYKETGAGSIFMPR